MPKGRALTVSEERPDLPVLYASGYTEDSIVRRGVLEEGMPYLQKPFDPSTLSRALRGVLDAKRAPTSGVRANGAPGNGGRPRARR